MFVRRIVRLFATVLALAAPAAATAEDGQTQLLFVGAAPGAGLDGARTDTFPVIAINALPAADAVRQEVFAARLRANRVSTFVDGPSDNDKQFEQLSLIHI